MRCYRVVKALPICMGELNRAPRFDARLYKLNRLPGEVEVPRFKTRIPPCFVLRVPSIARLIGPPLGAPHCRIWKRELKNPFDQFERGGNVADTCGRLCSQPFV